MSTVDTISRVRADIEAATADPRAHRYFLKSRASISAGIKATPTGSLIIPLSTELPPSPVAYQAISEAGVHTMPYGLPSGAFHAINGEQTPEARARVYVCVSWEAGERICSMTGHSVACAISDDNVPAVLAYMRAKFPTREVWEMEDATVLPGARQAPALQQTAQQPPAFAEPQREPVVGELLQRTIEDWRNEITAVVDADSDDLPAQYSEDNAALAFSRKFADDLRYVSAWGRWMRWDGARWVHDDSLMAYDLARKVCRSIAASARTDSTINPKQQEAIAGRYGQANTVAAIERLARADRRHAATTDQWDADKWCLNTPAGVVDLRTGKIRAPKRDDHMTKITACAPGGDCPTWRKFLDTATAGDVDLQGFLQRMAGYALTGSTRDHALFFVYGTGGNGKGTFLNTLTRILGDYAKVAGMEVFTETKGDRHPTELASLRGARLVSAQETEEGKRWNESRIKALTGGDPITARFMRMDEFTFLPQFKLVIAGNHKPGLRNVDEAMKRRLHLIPFDVTISPKDRDPSLPDRLQAESGGILSWMIQGCRDWEENGLRPPARVLAATAEYMETEDQIANWMSDCCIIHSEARAKSSKLYESYRQWTEKAGEFTLPQKRWLQQMAGKKLEPGKIEGSMTFRGIGLLDTVHGGGEGRFW